MTERKQRKRKCFYHNQHSYHATIWAIRAESNSRTEHSKEVPCSKEPGVRRAGWSLCSTSQDGTFRRQDTSGEERPCPGLW
jgi:hypothetical protein